jgi:hypothetical protein
MEAEGFKAELRKSKLVLHDGALEKHDDEGKIIARHELRDITALDVVWVPSYVGIIITATVGAAAFAAHTFIEVPWLRYCTAGLLVGIACLFVAGVQEQHLEVRCGEDVVRYQLNDERADNEGFVMTVKHQLRQLGNPRRTGAASGATDAPPPRLPAL